MADAVQFFACKFQNTRLGLHRHDPQAQDIAKVAQPAPAHRTHAARAACDKAADGGGGPGRGKHAQFLAGMGDASFVDLFQQRAGFGDDPSGVNGFDDVELVQVQDTAARQRHRLTIIAGAGAACRDRNVMGITDLQNFDYLGLGPWRDDEIGGHMVQPGFQDRGIPKEIPAFGFDRDGIGVEVQMGQRGLGGGDIGVGHGVPIKWSSSA